MNIGPQNRCGPNPYPDKMGAYLEQWSAIAASPVAMELHMVLGLVEFTTENIPDVVVPTALEVSLYKEGKPPIPADM